MSEVTIVTLAAGRARHLANLIIGASSQTLLPRELIIAVMGGAAFCDLPPAPFPIRQLMVPGSALSLAAARNAAARAACAETLVFLDVDCIPTPSLCADYLDAFDNYDGLLMGEVLYLPAGVEDQGWTYAAMENVAVKHSDRQGPPLEGLEICSDYRCFWSLNFSMRRNRFLATGGFDERYVGYGGEDTDFAKTIDQLGVPIAWLKGARAYHQHHPHHMPPIHHLDSVVRNAELFEAKWGYRTMGHWLHAFRLMGLIDDRPGQPIRILRRPSAEDKALTEQGCHQPYVNTATIIRYLEAVMAARALNEKEIIA